MVVDGLDREAVIAAVLAAGPEVIVHQMTALAGERSLRKVDQVFAATNELGPGAPTTCWRPRRGHPPGHRTEQWPRVRAFRRPGEGRDPIASRPPSPSSARALAAIKHVDKTVPLAAPEVVLPYGGFYGPGASDVLLDAVRKRQVPVISGGTRIWSFIEITDAATATLAAVDRGAPGVYNVVDSDPAPVAEWLPCLAEVAGAKPPLRVPMAQAGCSPERSSWP